MPPSYAKLRGCTCKVKYATKEAADKNANLVNKRTDRKGEVGYLCTFCNWFHVGRSRYASAEIV